MNEIYGTYYNGPEYNVAVENNPRYNEDRSSNANTADEHEQNIYLQL